MSLIVSMQEHADLWGRLEMTMQRGDMARATELLAVVKDHHAEVVRLAADLLAEEARWRQRYELVAKEVGR